MNKASITALPACNEGKAPKTIGDPVNPGVYSGMPNNSSIAAKPAGEPLTEYVAGTSPYLFSYHGGEHGKVNCIATPIRFIQPKLFANIGVVPGAAKTNMIAEQTTGAPKCIKPYGTQAITLKNVLVCAERILLRLAP